MSHIAKIIRIKKFLFFYFFNDNVQVFCVCYLYTYIFCTSLCTRRPNIDKNKICLNNLKYWDSADIKLIRIMNWLRVSFFLFLLAERDREWDNRHWKPRRNNTVPWYLEDKFKCQNEQGVRLFYNLWHDLDLWIELARNMLYFRDTPSLYLRIWGVYLLMIEM